MDATGREVYEGKRVGIMQPYFFPYLGYFGLIAHSDRWIVFDPVQYIRKGWMNRNRVLKAGGGEKFVSVTVAAHERDTLIKDMVLAPDAARFDLFLRQLDAYKLLRAPHYTTVVEVLRECFAAPSDRLVPFLTHTLQRTCAYLDIPFRHEVYSEMGLSHPTPKHPMEWSLYTCQEIGAAEYINPPGGRTFFDPVRFHDAGVRLLFHEQRLPAYDQRNPMFIPGLSIIDVMMFNAPSAIQDMLEQYELKEE
ncbi:MAG: WbqC family protein [Flavobacteriales bacterium]|nr:MAG: WbqC family protein [Flavobacteriales bacterium]